MSNTTIVRAWKDPAYRASLSNAERASLPGNPAGVIELSDSDLGKASGGFFTAVCSKHCTVFGSCDCSTNWPRGLPC